MMSLPLQVEKKQEFINRIKVWKFWFNIALIMITLFLGPTFSSAELARVSPAVVFMNRIEQQPALPSIKVHLTVKQRWLDQLPICKPVHISVLRPNHMTLEQNRLPGLRCHVPHWANDSQTRLNWRSWTEKKNIF